jgi:hypothetical protein
MVARRKSCPVLVVTGFPFPDEPDRLNEIVERWIGSLP